MNLFSKLFTIAFFLFVLFSCSNNKKKDTKIVIKDFNIIVNSSLLDSIYTHFSENIYIPISFISKSDTVKAKMRLRGDSSRKYDKKSLKIVFKKNEIPEGEKRKINLNSEWTDKSYIRQFISSKLMQKAGVIAYKSNFVRLSINNKFLGLYLQVENIDKEFLKKRHLDSKNNLYKATKDGASLSHFDDISAKWEKKTNKKESHEDLQQLINQIDTISVKEYKLFLKKTFEYDKLITIIAMNMLIQHGSTYYHNYYLYHNISENKKWQMFPWDMDKTLNFYSWKPYKYHETSSNWESDNPLIEKSFLNDEVFNDIRTKIIELGNTIFNNQTLDPIINQCKKLLEDAVKNDETDQIENASKWNYALTSEKEFISKQVKNILNQIDNLPRPFLLKRTNGPHSKNITLHWQKSKSKKPIKYKLLYGRDFLLENAETKIIENITDTFCTLKEIENGKYYWRVYASDGKNETEGFNTKNIFVMKDKKMLSKKTTHTILNKRNSPYLLDVNFIIDKNESLTIENGVVLYIANNAQIINNGGTLEFKGKSHSQITIYPEDENFKSIKLKNASRTTIINTTFYNTAFLIENSKASFLNTEILITGSTKTWNPTIFCINSEIIFSKSKLINYKKPRTEGLTLIDGQCSISNSYFYGFPDVVELTRTHNSQIIGNTIYKSEDDGIDLNACNNINIKDNKILDIKDSGISIGNDNGFETKYKALYGDSKNITITNNYIENATIGIKIKNNSKHIEIEDNFLKHNLNAFKIDSATYIQNKITFDDNTLDSCNIKAL